MYTCESFIAGPLAVKENFVTRPASRRRFGPLENRNSPNRIGPAQRPIINPLLRLDRALAVGYSYNVMMMMLLSVKPLLNGNGKLCIYKVV